MPKSKLNPIQPGLKVKNRSQKVKSVKKQGSISEKGNVKGAVAAGKQIMRGRVVAVKTLKTATVLIGRIKKHSLYGKSFKRSKRYLVHDDLGVAAGDVVEIMQTKPVSRHKRFQITRVIGQNVEAIISVQLKEDAEKEIAEASH